MPSMSLSLFLAVLLLLLFMPGTIFNRSIHNSARSTVSENTVDTECNMSTDSCPNSSNLTAASSCLVSWWREEDAEEKDDEVEDLGPSMGDPAGEFVVDLMSLRDA